MRDKILVVSTLLIALMVISMAVAPSRAFVYPDGSQDDLFENFGPRIDQILIKKYADLNAEMAALQNGEIDITDWALDKTWIDTFATDPDVAVLSYGGEAGYYTMNFNNNPNEFLGNPPDPTYSNPVYPNPMSVKELRQACSHLIDRATLVSGPGQGLYEAIYTPIPAYMGYWIHPEISYTGLLSALAYPPSVADAAAKLDAGGFHLGGAGGKRYWDKNDNNIYDGASEDFTLKAYTRLDILSKGAADMLCAGFDDPLVNVAYTRIPCTAGQAWQTCMVEKNYHLYTAGWTGIGPDPDYMFDLYHWTSYYHPEDPPNYGATSVNDPIMQTALQGIKYANSPEDAQEAALAFQVQFATMASECPLGATSSPKAYNKWYTGGNDGAAKGDAEDKYRGQAWTQVVNEMGQGENSYYTFLNAYPGTYQYGDGNMIARYGWCDNSMPQTLNPMYSSWYWEMEVIEKAYDRLGSRDPMTKGPVEVSALAENWTVGTWVHPVTSEILSKVTLRIRSDVKWSDGAPMTMSDVIYTFIDMPKELKAKGCPDVRWQPTLDRIVSYFRLDAYTVEILLDVNTYLGANWVAGNVVIPKHIWQPYIATHSVADICGDMSDQPEMLIGTGPFIYVSNTAETLLLTKNLNYYQIIAIMASGFEHVATSMKKGITVEAVAPTTQITPYKVKPAGTPLTANVKVMIPQTNLDVNDAQGIHKKVEIVCANGTTVQLAEFFNLVLDPLEIDKEIFNLYNLAPGTYTLRVIVEVTSGDLFEWVHDHLDPSLWEMILGPRVVEKKFWVTVAADLNGDGVVDIFDLVFIALAFGSTIGDANYKPQADLDYNGRVDIFDIANIAISFGWPGPPPPPPPTFEGRRNSLLDKCKTIPNEGDRALVLEALDVLKDPFVNGGNIQDGGDLNSTDNNTTGMTRGLWTWDNTTHSWTGNIDVLIDTDNPGGTLTDGHFWNPIDIDNDTDRDDCDVINTMVHEARHAWQLKLCTLKLNESEVGIDLNNDGDMTDINVPNDWDGDLLPSWVPAGKGFETYIKDDDRTVQASAATRSQRYEDDAYPFQEKVPKTPWW